MKQPGDDDQAVKLLAAVIRAIHDHRQEKYEGPLTAGAGNTCPSFSWPTGHLCADCGAPTTKDERDTAQTAGYRTPVCSSCKDQAEETHAALARRARQPTSPAKNPPAAPQADPA